MKNLILSVFSVILLSCHPVAASAEVIDNNLNVTGLQLTLCEEIADYSQSVSLAHQHNISYEYVKSIAPEANTQAEKQIKIVLDAIMYEAYQLPVVEGNVNKMLLSEEFSKQVYLVCVGEDYL